MQLTKARILKTIKLLCKSRWGGHLIDQSRMILNPWIVHLKTYSRKELSELLLIQPMLKRMKNLNFQEWTSITWLVEDFNKENLLNNQKLALKAMLHLKTLWIKTRLWMKLQMKMNKMVKKSFQCTRNEGTFFPGMLSCTFTFVETSSTQSFCWMTETVLRIWILKRVRERLVSRAASSRQ